MNKYCNANFLIIWVLVFFMSASFAHAIDANIMTSPLTPITLSIEKKNNDQFFLRVKNNSESKHSFTSNIKVVLSSTFLNFPKLASLEFDSERQWQKIAKFSSQADPPKLNYNETQKIILNAGEVIEYPIDYTGAINIATVRLTPNQVLPKKFRIKIPIQTLVDGNIEHQDLMSDWQSCESLIEQIIKLRIP